RWACTSAWAWRRCREGRTGSGRNGRSWDPRVHRARGDRIAREGEPPSARDARGCPADRLAELDVDSVDGPVAVGVGRADAGHRRPRSDLDGAVVERVGEERGLVVDFELQSVDSRG